jgi:hypothetical protein
MSWSQSFVKKDHQFCFYIDYSNIQFPQNRLEPFQLWLSFLDFFPPTQKVDQARTFLEYFIEWFRYLKEFSNKLSGIIWSRDYFGLS